MNIWIFYQNRIKIDQGFLNGFKIEIIHIFAVIFVIIIILIDFLYIRIIQMHGINTKCINIEMKCLIDIEFGGIPSSFITFCPIYFFMPSEADHNIVKRVVYRMFTIGEDVEFVEKCNIKKNYESDTTKP